MSELFVELPPPVGRARWISEAGDPPPSRFRTADDRTRADAALRILESGQGLLYLGDHRNAMQLLSALGRRLKPRRASKPMELPDAFRRERSQRYREHSVLGRLCVPLDEERRPMLSHAPDVAAACEQAWGARDGTRTVVALRELLGVVGAWQWREKGIPIRALGGERVHPHYGVFAPVRQEYVDLVARAPLPAVSLAFDIGAGTGILSLVLARRGVRQLIATDVDPRAIACAKENAARFGLADRIRLEQRELFPDGRASLLICNPPWVPGEPRTPVDRAILDPDSRMLRGFLSGAREHLEPDGEAWLVLSNFAERVGARDEADLPRWIDLAGLEVIETLIEPPRHPKASDETDPLHEARAREVTTLYRLRSRR